MESDPGCESSDKVGYKRPPLHTRFRPGQSGNPSGRRKGIAQSQDPVRQILREELSLREGSTVRKISKAEAVLRGLVVGALKGDQRSLATMFRLTEQTGHFEEAHSPIAGITRVIVETGVPRAEGGLVPSCSEFSKD